MTASAVLPSPLASTALALRGFAPARLAVQGLACRRGERLLFKGLTVDIGPGQVLWVRGANGRGKTSLLRLLTGLASPADGQLLWDQGQGAQALKSAGAAFRQRLLYIGHANGLKDDLSVREALQFLARIHGRPCDETVLDAALRRLGLHSRRAAPVRTLSQGQRRRVALARLALDLSLPEGASFWVLDEPIDALDAEGMATLNELLSDQAARGGCVALTSHLPLTLTDPEPLQLHLDALSSRRHAEPNAATPPAPAA
jgi:heme exporter protein A